MVLLAVHALAAYTVLVMFWKIVRWLLVESPLECIPGPPPQSFIGGNIKQLFGHHNWSFYFDILERYGSVAKLKGVFGENMLLTFDPKAMYHVLVKDQDAFEEDPSFIALNKVLFGDGLLSTIGDQHRKQRKMLTPVFSTAHMRGMTPIFYEVTHRLRQAFNNQTNNGPKEVDLLHWLSRTALELIGQSGMGYSFDSLKEVSDDTDVHPYSRCVTRFGGFLTGPIPFLVARFLLPITNQLKFPQFKRWIVEHLPSQWVQDLKVTVDVMHQTAVDICRSKQQEIISGEDDEKKDIISTLTRANASVAEKDRLTDDEVVGQVATLVFAAMDTTSCLLSRILLLLANHPHIQERLRNELIEAKENNGGEDLDYDQLAALPYLDAVCRETLRIARKDTVLPLSKPLSTIYGTEITEFIVPNGTTVFLSIIGANSNPEWWGEDSSEWKPERWLKPLPDTVGEAHMPCVYSSLMSFLGGNRSCIGFKFAQLEARVVLSVLLTSFRFEDAGKEIVWKMPGISSPSVEGKDSLRPALPMVISRLDEQ